MSVDIDNDAVLTQGSAYMMEVAFEPITLSAATNYRLAFVGTSTTNTTVYYGDVNAAGYMDGFILGQNAHWTQHDGTSWSQTTTRRPQFGLGYSAFHDGASSGGTGFMMV